MCVRDVSKLIFSHVQVAFAAAGELARASGKQFEVELQQEEPTSAFFAARSIVGTVSTRVGDSGRLRLSRNRANALQDKRGGAVRTGDAALSPAASLERYIERKYLSGGQNTMGDDASAAVRQCGGWGGG